MVWLKFFRDNLVDTFIEMIISETFFKLKLLEQLGAVPQAIQRSSSPSWLVNSARASLIRLLSSLTPSTNICRASPPPPPPCRAKRLRIKRQCANSVLIADPKRKRKKERTNRRVLVWVRLHVRLSQHFSVNEPHMLLANPVGPLAPRDPHHDVSRDLTPHCSRGDDHDRSVGPRFYPYRTPILHDTVAHLRLPSILPPLHSVPRRRGYNPFHLQGSLPTRSLNSSRSLPPLFFISFTLLGVPFARLLPHRHLQPPPRFSRSLSPSISFSPLLTLLVIPSPTRVAQCRNTYDGTSVLLTSQVSALG